MVRLAIRRDKVRSWVKIMKRDHIDDNGLRRLRNEADLLGRVNSSNVVKLHRLYQERDAIYMAVEACHGEFNGTSGSPSLPRLISVGNRAIEHQDQLAEISGNMQ